MSDDANPGAIEIRRVILGGVCQRAAGFYYAAFERKLAFDLERWDHCVCR